MIQGDQMTSQKHTCTAALVAYTYNNEIVGERV